MWNYEGKSKCKGCKRSVSSRRYTLDKYKNYCDRCMGERREREGLIKRLSLELGLKESTVKRYLKSGEIVVNEDGSYIRVPRKRIETQYELIGAKLSDISPEDELSPTQHPFITQHGRKVLKGANPKNYGCTINKKGIIIKKRYETGDKCWRCGSEKPKNYAYCDDCRELFSEERSKIQRYADGIKIKNTLEMAEQGYFNHTVPICEGHKIPPVAIKPLIGFPREVLDENYYPEEIAEMRQLENGNYLVHKAPQGIESYSETLDINFDVVEGEYKIDDHTLEGLNRGYKIVKGEWE